MLQFGGRHGERLGGEQGGRHGGHYEVDKLADMVAGHGCWLIGPQLFRPEP